MSNKKLLEESTVEKFMKLAKIDASKSKQFLAENFTEELEERDRPTNEMEMEEMGAYGSSEMDELEMPDDLALEELDLFEEEDEERGEEEEDMGELAMSSEEAEQIIDTLEMLLSKLRMAVGAEEEPEMEEPEMEEPEMEEPEPEEDEGEEPAEEAPEGEEEEPEALQEAMVNRIAKRVAARLLKEKNNK
jgi:hypothetical protein